tara:strand:+ start:3024 stop:3197 length:174 start_codon:yes stop_codon:yes gene_type:complete
MKPITNNQEKNMQEPKRYGFGKRIRRSSGKKDYPAIPPRTVCPVDGVGMKGCEEKDD